MLTIVGYSINATIVIFDRIREELKVDGKASGDPVRLKELVNRCITQTLTRSIYTSLTTFITVAVLYVMGVSSIKEFALPLMVGIVCGAYSSVCITGALWYTMRTWGVRKQTASQSQAAAGAETSASVSVKGGAADKTPAVGGASAGNAGQGSRKSSTRYTKGKDKKKVK